MKRLVCLSTGDVWRCFPKEGNRNLHLDYVLNSGARIDGVELTFGNWEHQRPAVPTPRQKKRLRQMKRVSMHPGFDVPKNAKERAHVRHLLDQYEEIYHYAGAKAMVIHPDQLPPPEMLFGRDINVVTENLTHNTGFSTAMLQKTLQKYPKIGLCLDVAHAYAWSPKTAASLIKRFGKRLSQVHFSVSRAGTDHLPLSNATAGFWKSVAPVKKRDVPLVIEVEMPVCDAGYLREEVERVRDWVRGASP